MTGRLQRIADRRRQLLTADAAHRLIIVACIRPWQRPLTAIAKASTLPALWRHPLWLLASAGVIAVLPIGRPRRWLERAWVTGYAVLTVVDRMRGSRIEASTRPQVDRCEPPPDRTSNTATPVRNGR